MGGYKPVAVIKRYEDEASREITAAASDVSRKHDCKHK